MTYVCVCVSFSLSKRNLVNLPIKMEFYQESVLQETNSSLKYKLILDSAADTLNISYFKRRHVFPTETVVANLSILKKIQNSWSKWYPSKTMTNAIYTNDQAPLANTQAQTESLLHRLEQAAGISISVKLGGNISSIESDVNRDQAKA